MNCNCRWTEGVVAAVILLVTIWPNLLGAVVSMWIVVVAAAILLLHSVFHHKCGCAMCAEGKQTSRKKRR